MPSVNTVLGPVDTGDLGFTLMHEHVMVGSAGVQQVYPEFLDMNAIKEKSLADLSDARSGGVQTIVDVTPMDLGRDILLLQDMSRQTGVHIIAATGSWLDIPRAFWNADPDEIAALYIKEIEVGIEETGIKAGIIKVANDRDGITPQGEVILRAAARTCKATNVPISTHTYPQGRIGEEQVHIFEDEGINLAQVYIGHSNDTADTEYLFGLLKKNVWLGLDRYPGGFLPDSLDWERRTEVAKQLIDAGFANQIFLSHDWVAYPYGGTPRLREQRRVHNPDGYLFITRKVLPHLEEAGVSSTAINRIMVENPRHFFEGYRQS
jgi:phosphotriesterase-related protein